MFLLSACILLPGGEAVDAGLKVHKAGAARHNLAVRMPVEPEVLYAALLRVVEQDSDVRVVRRSDHVMSLEATEHDKRMTGQVTSLGDSEAVLYVWADAGKGGRTGSELATMVVDAVSRDLGVDYETVTY